MTQAGIAGRLRVTGIILVVTIAAVVILQAAVVEWRFASAPVQTDVVNASGLRRSLTIAVLYRAAALANSPHEVRPLNDAVEALAGSQRAFDDLDASDLKLFRTFLATVPAVERDPRNRSLQARLESLGIALGGVYDRATNAHALDGSRTRATFRNAVLAGCAAILLAIALLYFTVMRTRQAAIAAAIDEIEDRRERFSAMFDNTSEIMLIYECDGRIVRANASALETLGFGADVLNRHYDVHVAVKDRPLVAREFAAAVSGRAVGFATTFLDAAGREIPVMAHLSPIAVRGRVVGIVGAARDVSAERRYEEEMMRSREHFRSLFTGSPSAILAVDAEGIVTAANAALERLTGYASEELVGQSFTTIVPPGLRATARDRFSELLDGGGRSYAAPAYTREGQEILLEVDATPIRVGGKVEGVFYTSRDLTLETAMRRQLEEKDERVRTLLRVATSSWHGSAQIGDALLHGSRVLAMEYGYVVQMQAGIVTVRHRCGPDDFLPIGHAMTATPSIGGRLAAAGDRAIAIDDLTIEPYAGELRERNLPWKSYIGSGLSIDGTAYGAIAFLNRSVRATHFEQADLDFMNVLSSLIASAVAREALQQDLQGKATQDKLTGLPNRAMLDEQFRRMLARARRRGERIAVHYVDLDSFKPVNDRYGHAAGDEVLCETARRFASAVRGEDVVARLGGDEFVVVQGVGTDETVIAKLTQRVIRALEAPIELSGGTSVAVGASLGSAFYPEDGKDLEALLLAADAGMYRNKRAKHDRKRDE